MQTLSTPLLRHLISLVLFICVGSGVGCGEPKPVLPDASVVDSGAPLPVDAGALDAGGIPGCGSPSCPNGQCAPDGGCVECFSDAHCASTGERCLAAEGRCVGCVTSPSDSCPASQYCNSATQ